MRVQRRNTYFCVKESKFQLDSYLHESHLKQNSLFILDFIKCHLFVSTSLPSQSDFHISFKVFCIKVSYVFSFPEFLQNQPSLHRLRTHNPELDLSLLCQYVFGRLFSGGFLFPMLPSNLRLLETKSMYAPSFLPSWGPLALFLLMVLFHARFLACVTKEKRVK